MTDTEVPLTPAVTFAGIVAVWILAAVGAVVVLAAVAPEDRFGGLCLSLAVCAIAAFCVQLATRRRDGFVSRVVASFVGSVVITAIAGIVVAATL
ncbi:hypothetical protein WJX64_00070 [Leifsonia sp. YIM 134122]|uniref:Uncharacterized protein n=1 Tax=Leifsonia stereocauli TaxID=3134136 RepID=A0ABU9VZD6_9MICO